MTMMTPRRRSTESIRRDPATGIRTFAPEHASVEARHPARAAFTQIRSGHVAASYAKPGDSIAGASVSQPGERATNGSHRTSTRAGATACTLTETAAFPAARSCRCGSNLSFERRT